MTGVLHLLNQTPIFWFSKHQGCVHSATYGSELMVACTATEQIMDLRYTLRMMGVPIDGPSWMFGDNQSVITSSTTPESSLNNVTMHYPITLFVSVLLQKFFTLSMSKVATTQVISLPRS
jgi:hypothetical protein